MKEKQFAVRWAQRVCMQKPTTDAAQFIDDGNRETACQTVKLLLRLHGEFQLRQHPSFRRAEPIRHAELRRHLQPDRQAAP